MSKPFLKIVIALHRVTNHLDRGTAKIASAYGLSLGQFSVLEALFHKGAMSVGEVQMKILSSSGTIPVILNNLQKRGLITKRHDLFDKRRSLIDLSLKGRELISEVYPVNEAYLSRALSGLTDKEQSALLSLLKKTGENIHESNDCKTSSGV